MEAIAVQALQGLTVTAWFSSEARRLETLRVDALEEGEDAHRDSHRQRLPHPLHPR